MVFAPSTPRSGHLPVLMGKWAQVGCNLHTGRVPEEVERKVQTKPVMPGTESSQLVKRVFVVQHSCEFDGCEETKLIGVYTTRQAADEAIRRLAVAPGFRDHPNDFSVDEYPLDVDHWSEGFITD